MQNGNQVNNSDREILSVRVFNHPREQVFKAWEDPTLLANWWGPKGFTNTFHAFDFRPGGNWDFTMHGPDGTDYHNKSVFNKIVKPGQIIFEHMKPMHKFKVTATFEELDNKTKLSFCMLFESVKECEEVKLYVVDANEENFDRLETVLSKMPISHS